MSAAGESDILFVKTLPGKPSDLAKHCDKTNVDYMPFTSFTEVRDHVKSIVEGSSTVEQLVEEGRRAKTY